MHMSNTCLHFVNTNPKTCSICQRDVLRSVRVGLVHRAMHSDPRATPLEVPMVSHSMKGDFLENILSLNFYLLKDCTGSE